MKRLYFGDCLDILKILNKEHPEGFIDFIYIDPPFNSKRDYNILFESHDIIGDATAQKQAFTDTWSNVSYLDTLHEIQEIDLDLYQLLSNFDSIRISKSAVSYLTTMAIRILYIHKVLKETGSFYLHCDSYMSHYLKLLCDLIFGKDNFRNEIIWQKIRTTKAQTEGFGNVHDIIFLYSKSENILFKSQYKPFDPEYIKSHYKKDKESGRLFRTVSLLQRGQGQSRLFGNKVLEPPTGTHWVWSQERIDEAIKNNLIRFTSNGRPEKIQYLDEMIGDNVDDIWTDIFPINSQASERLDYPTQKPESLLERIIKASSNEGDLIADFFCGCGTTIAVAEKFKRNWIGVDISHLAIRLVKDRLIKPYRKNKEKVKKILSEIEIHGLPKDIGSAKELAENTESGRLEFQDWIIEVMLGGVSNIKKVADGGFDGYLTFNKTDKQKELVLIEVKSGNVNVKNLREFIQVTNTKKASIGVFVCFSEHITKPMQHEAKKEGYYDEKAWGKKFDKIQIISVEDLLDGAGVNIPESTKTTFKTAKFKYKKGEQESLDLS